MAQHKELIGVQFLRGICASAVVVDHAQGMLATPKYGGLPFLGGALEYGFLGVDIFFVISAFIIAIVVLRGPGLTPALSPTTFFEKRFTRIIPLMWVAVLSYVVLQYAFARSSIDVGAYVRALLLLPWSTVKPDMIWTLRQEFFFYTLFCASFFGPRALRLLIVAWIVSPIAYLAWIGSPGGTTGFINSTASIAFSAVNLEFGAGLALGIWWVKRAPQSDIRLPLHPLLALLLIVLAAFALCWWLELGTQTIALTTLMGVLGAGIVHLGARSLCPPGRLTRIGLLIGNASYAIYLFHLHVLATVLALRMKLGIGGSAPLLIAIFSLMAILAGIAVHLLIERPLIGWTRHLRLPRRAAASPAS